MQPFQLVNLTSNLLYFTISTSIICLIHFLLFYFVIINFSKSFFDPESWTLGKHLLCLFCTKISIAIVIWVFNKFIIGGKIIDSMSFLLSLKIVFSVGLVPFFLYFVIDERYGRIFRKRVSQEIMQETNLSKNKRKNERKTNNDVTIFAQNSKDFLTFSIDSLIYINTQGNYTSFFTLNDNVLKEQILRISLSAAIDEFANFPFIFKCHKSYIVNTHFVNEITGNSRGYSFHIDEYDIVIPVSRQFNKKELINYLK